MSETPHASIRAARTGNDEFLLTPGPLTTSLTVKQAMLRDWGSRDKKFIAMNARIRDKLVRIAGGAGDYVCVPVQGSGTFAVEATLGTLLPRDGKLLVLVNGAYGERMMKIAKYMGRAAVALSCAEDRTPDLGSLETLLAEDKAITHVAAVHCETTSGILNPIREIADIVAKHGRSLIVDTMSAFGAIPLDVKEVTCDAIVASSNKCFEGVPGVGYAIVRRGALEECEGNAHALSLDLYDQWRGLEANAQWRFTPPTHVLAAFDTALSEFEQEGAVAGRNARYSENCRTLVDGMRALGFETLLPDALQAPIIVTFHMPADPKFDFQAFYDRLAARGYVIYPGKLTVAPTFRIGCIGKLEKGDLEAALAVIAEELAAMGVTQCGPAADAAE